VEEQRNRLTMKLEWPNGRPGARAQVGLFYVQKGIRWIPGYRVSIDGKGTAKVRLQATLVNEMVDLRNVTANLVIGVPSFAFKETLDPIALQQTYAQLSQYFDPGSRGNFGLSNAIMSQARFGERGPAGPAGPVAPAGPEVGNGEKSEDLFVFAVRNVSLKKGDRMVIPVAEYTVKYRDVYVLDVPLGPPQEVRGNLNTEQQAQIARLLSAPKVMHRIRLENSTQHPFTTAPALLLSGERVLSQGMMTYTPVGGQSDIDLTTAVDIAVKKTEAETGRRPNAIALQGDQYARVDLEGTLRLTNHGKEAVTVEVTRSVLGKADSASHDGKIAGLSPFEDESRDVLRVPWWGWYSWPYWWSHVNGVDRITWTVTLDPKKAVDLAYKWHYFWR
jgi:hypothetical protein